MPTLRAHSAVALRMVSAGNLRYFLFSPSAQNSLPWAYVVQSDMPMSIFTVVRGLCWNFGMMECWKNGILECWNNRYQNRRDINPTNPSNPINETNRIDRTDQINRINRINPTSMIVEEGTSTGVDMVFFELSIQGISMDSQDL